MSRLYQINQVKRIALERDYRGEKTLVEEQVLAIQLGSIRIYQDVFYASCRYSFQPTLVSVGETLYIHELSGIEPFCTEAEKMIGLISKARLIEIYNQLNLPEYAITEKQLNLQKKYGD